MHKHEIAFPISSFRFGIDHIRMRNNSISYKDVFVCLFGYCNMDLKKNISRYITEYIPNNNDMILWDILFMYLEFYDAFEGKRLFC